MFHGYGEDENFEARSDESHALHNHSQQNEMRPVKRQKINLILTATVIYFRMPFDNCCKVYHCNYVYILKNIF